MATEGKFQCKVWCNGVITLLLAASVMAEADSEGWPVNACIEDGSCFDYIIIGSGSGAVVANRLSEDPSNRILLLEAGTTPSNASRFASNFPAIANTDMDWLIKSVPELTSQSQSGDVFKLTAGKTLGGSSQLNHILWFRCDPHDFNSWGVKVNDSSWGYNSVLPYFLKIESMKDKEILANTKIGHDNNGPIEITRETNEKNDAYLKSFEEAGHKVKLHLNEEDTVGNTQPTVMNNIIRQSTSEKYLKPIVDRKNLHVSYNSLVTKINIIKNRAVSVNVLINGKEITVKACKEIILSAGTFNSPKLLMLSGVGPKEHLESLNIPVLKDLPVGKNLQDHVITTIVIKMNETNEVVENLPLTSIGFQALVGAVKLNDSLDYPQGQMTHIMLPHDSPGQEMLYDNVLGYKKQIYDTLIKSSVDRDVVISLPTLVDPSSTGEITLSSTDALAPPLIRLNYYSDPSDLDKMVALVENFVKVLNTTFFKSVKAEIINLTFDDCKGDFSSRDYIRCYIQHMTSTLFHQVGTCAMGSVVDSKLKVKGVEGLRVVDASIMPHVPTANTVAPAIMIAEKASDMIKADQNCAQRVCNGCKRRACYYH